MKILHLIDSAGIYGAEQVLVELAKVHLDQKINVTIGSITRNLNTEKGIVTLAKANNIPTQAFKVGVGLDMVGIYRVAQYCSDNSIDILHCHGYKDRILVSLLPSFFFRNTRIVTTLHGWTESRGTTKLSLYHQMDMWRLKSFDDIVCVSDIIVNMKQLKGKNVHLIPNGIGKFSSPQTSNIFSKKVGVVVFSIGRLSYEKGYDNLLNAIAIAQKRYDLPECHFYIAGEGPELEDLRALSKSLEIEELVTFLGYIEDAGAYISYSDLLVNFSRSEGLPITLLESMRAYKPVLFSSVGEVTQALSGFEELALCEPTDIQSYAKKLEHLLNNPKQRINLGAALRLRLEERYTSKTMGFKYLEVYKSLISGTNN